MEKQKWLVLASLMCVLGCTENPGVVDQSKYCIPSCDLMSEKCVDGTCVSLCSEGCNEDERCELGECVPLTCMPACDADHICVKGSCEPKPEDPNTCKGLMCKDNMTRCDTATGVWTECPLGTGCHLGYCLEGLGVECETGTCSEDGTKACVAGKWATCGSLEVCTAGECDLIDGACEPGSCSEDGAYVCNDEGVYEDCGTGLVCREGICDLNYDTEAAMLWTLCNKNSDCPSGMCMFEVTPSRSFSSLVYSLVNVDRISVSFLDDRIPEGFGICSLDCTKDANVCDALNTGNVKYSCQLAFVGDSPYPPEDDQGNTLNLPFHKASTFKLSDMEVAPYAAICRPNDVYGRMYAKTFCASCQTSSECSADEVCAGGFCASKCSSNEMCPLGFSCVNLSGDSETENKVCMPNSGTCGDCLDLDGDGQGFGHCAVPGYDCDQGDPNIYYTKDLPKTCTHDATDTNCNGKIDTFELLNSEAHCRFCNDPCIDLNEELHMGRACKDIKTIDDYAFSAFNAADESTYLTQCLETCVEGWGDCNRDYRDGCEVNLIANGVKYSLDEDKDGRGVINDRRAVYCCGYDTSNCYAYETSRYTPKGNWGRPDNNAWNNVQNGSELISPDVTDCNDEDRYSYNGNAEICDGKNNACNDFADGKDDIYIDNVTSDEIQLDGSCNVYNNQGSICATGQVKCIKGDNEQYDMKCVAEIVSDETGTEVCDGNDNDCDGLIDEHYKPVFTDASIETLRNEDGSIDICKYRMTYCDSQNKVIYDENGGYQMFEPRNFDFYGDGIDSNCDGFDYDVNKAIFIAAAGEGLGDGNNNHSGRPGSPVKTLNYAIELACKNASTSYYCEDIIVIKDQNALVDTTWVDGPILVKTFSSRNEYTNYTRLDNFENVRCSKYNCLEKTLLPNEKIPSEAVRIYGGFEPIEKGKGFKQKGKTTMYSYTYNPNKKANTMFALVQGNGEYPLSLKLDHVPLQLESIAIAGTETVEKNGKDVINSINEELQDGLMLVGITCGKVGCRHLTLNNSSIKVTGQKGRDNSNLQHASNVWKSEYMQGVGGKHFYRDWTDWDKNQANFLTNRSNNAMFSNYYNNSTNVWSSVPSSEYSIKCPDGTSPRGGAPGARCCKNGCSSVNNKSGRSGNSGSGTGYGGSGLKQDVNTGDSCGKDSSFSGDGDDYKTYEKSGVFGSNGSHGNGGAGGKNSDVTCNDVIDASTGGFFVKCDTSKANGKPGASGGGGGGGSVYRCYARSGKTDPWVHGGSGGAGGCGGYGGKAGGVGMSATGLILNAPNNSSGQSNNNSGQSKDLFSLNINGSTISVTAGSGGNAQSGQPGVNGGWRGAGFGYAKKVVAVPYHCHKATGGGVGGTGGSGGNGANGLSGQAFGIVFLDSEDLTPPKGMGIDGIKSKFEENYYEFTSSLEGIVTSPGNYVAKPITQAHGSDGSRGKSRDASITPQFNFAAQVDSTQAVNSPNNNGSSGSGASSMLKYLTHGSF